MDRRSRLNSPTEGRRPACHRARAPPWTLSWRHVLKRRLAAHFQDLDLSDHRIAVDALIEGDQTIGHREYRVWIAFCQILLNQEGGSMPAAQVYAKLLNELLNAGGAFGMARLQPD